VIISDATNPKMFDSWTLYTREFYELAKSRLQPDGVFCQWVLIPLPGDAIQVILKTFQTVFPHASFWCIYGSSQCMMLATPDRLEIDYPEFADKLAPVIDSDDLSEYGIDSVEKFLSFLLLGEDELRRALEGFDKIGTDDLPHAQFRVKQEQEGVRASLDLLRYQGSVLPYLTNLGEQADRVERELDAYLSISRRLTLGFLLNDTGEFREAAEVAREAGWNDDQNVAVMLGYDRSRKKYFEQRVIDHPEDASAHNNLGFIYWKEERYDEAIDQIRAAIALNGEFANARVNLARVQIDAGRFDAAVVTLLEVRDLNPTQSILQLVDNQLTLVRALRKQQFQGSTAEIALTLAGIYRREGDMVRAAAATRTAAKLSGEDSRLYMMLAGMYENLEFVDRALETYETLAAMRPDDAQVRQKLEEFRVLQDDRTARQRWLNSNEVVFHQNGGGDGHQETCYAASRAWNDYDFDGTIEPAKLREAAALYEQSLAAQRDDMHAYQDLALVYEILADYGRAASTWRRGLAVSPDNPAAEVAVKRLELLETLHKGGLDPERESGIFEDIGGLHLMAGEFERALEYFQRATGKTYADVEILLGMASAFTGAGQYDRAVGAYERALALGPESDRAATINRRLATVRDLMTDPD
jgi:tetratricopeptide (TPR) repeat protein